MRGFCLCVLGFLTLYAVLDGDRCIDVVINQYFPVRKKNKNPILMADFSHLLEVSGNQRERVRSTSSSSEPGSPTRSGSNVGSVNTRAPTGSPRRRKGGNTPSHHDVDRSSSKGTATGRRSADAAALGAGGRRPSAAPGQYDACGPLPWYGSMCYSLHFKEKKGAVRGA